MKKFLRRYLYNLLTIWLLSITTNAFSYPDYQSLFLGVLILTLLTIFIKPLVNLLFLPIKLISFGLLTWVPTTIIIYTTHLITPDFSLTNIHLQAFSGSYLSMPNIYFGTTASIITTTFLYIILKKILRKVM